MNIHYPLNPTTGLEDITRLPWTNGNPATGVEGSYPPYQLCVDPQTEIINTISEAGIAPSELDLAQLLRAIRGGQLTTYTDTSVTANSIQIAPMTPHNGAAKGLPFRIFPAVTNTSTTVNVTVNSLAAIRLKKRDGTDPAIGDIVAGTPIDVVADGTNLRVIGLLASDINGLLGTLNTLNNVQQFNTTTRVTMTGNVGNSYTVTPWSPGNYTKKSSTSVLIIFVSGLTYVAGATGPSIATLTLGASTFNFGVNNAVSGSASNASTLMTTIGGIASGSLATSLAYKRLDATNWTGSFCCNSTDNTYLPAAMNGSIIIGELGT